MNNIEFYYLMKLHYSQTVIGFKKPIHKFYYLMKLHYSQTSRGLCAAGKGVLLPYEITLLSNGETIEELTLVFYYLMKLHYSQTSNLK